MQQHMHDVAVTGNNAFHTALPEPVDNQLVAQVTQAAGISKNGMILHGVKIVLYRTIVKAIFVAACSLPGGTLVVPASLR